MKIQTITINKVQLLININNVTFVTTIKIDQKNEESYEFRSKQKGTKNGSDLLEKRQKKMGNKVKKIRQKIGLVVFISLDACGAAVSVLLFDCAGPHY